MKMKALTCAVLVGLLAFLEPSQGGPLQDQIQEMMAKLQELASMDNGLNVSTESKKAPRRVLQGKSAVDSNQCLTQAVIDNSDKVNGVESKTDGNTDEIDALKIGLSEALARIDLLESQVGQCSCNGDSPDHNSTCHKIRQSGQLNSGVYEVDRGAGKFDIYCEMDTDFLGGGWDLISYMTTTNDGANYLFGPDRCTALSGPQCFGNINAGNAMDSSRPLAVQDAELLIVGYNDDGTVKSWAALEGFDHGPGADDYDLMRDYATLIRKVDDTSSCSPPNNMCGHQESGLKMSGHSGWSPLASHINIGLHTWWRLGGLWIGDDTGAGGCGPNNFVDIGYSHDGVAFRCENIASRGAFFWRSKTFVRA